MHAELLHQKVGEVEARLMGDLAFLKGHHQEQMDELKANYNSEVRMYMSVPRFYDIIYVWNNICVECNYYAVRICTAKCIEVIFLCFQIGKIISDHHQILLSFKEGRAVDRTGLDDMEEDSLLIKIAVS